MRVDQPTHQECGVETKSELFNVSLGSESLHESLGPGLGVGAQVVDHFRLGHPDTGVDDGEGLGIGVREDLDEQLLLVVQLSGLSEGLVLDLVQGLGGVVDQLPEEDLFVGDPAYQLSNLATHARARE